MSEITLSDIRKALEEIEYENSYLCTCETAKKYGGECHKHNLFWLTKEQQELFKRAVGL